MGFTILLANEQDIVREGLRSVLQGMSNISTLLESRDAIGAVAMVAEHSPALAIVSGQLQTREGDDLVRRLTHLPQAARRTRVIVLANSADRFRVAAAFRNSASGYLKMDCSAEELRAAVRAVLDGRTYLSPAAADNLVDGIRHVGGDLPDPDMAQTQQLTRREREVLELLAEGMTNKEIASALVITTKTVEAHRGQIMAKLQLHSVAKLTKFAIRQGLASLDV